MKKLMIEFNEWSVTWCQSQWTILNNKPVLRWQDDNNNVYSTEKLYDLFMKEKMG